MSGNPALISLAHSPDPDDAFMWWALTPDATGDSPLATGRFRFDISMTDIESLNQQSRDCRYDVTAISCAQYPHVADAYAIASCGASFGLEYGPKLVSRSAASIEEIAESERPIAVPGMRTTAALLTAMILECEPSRFVAIDFDAVIDRVASAEFEYGVVIHEGQLTFGQAGLELVCDLGAWWHVQHGLPLPLGLNVARKNIDERFGEGASHEIGRLLRKSVDHAMEHRTEAVAYSMQFARGVSSEQADEFVRMYVNELTLDCGERGRRAIETLLEAGAKRGMLPALRGASGTAGGIDVIPCG